MITHQLPFFKPYKVSRAWAAKLQRRVLTRAWLSRDGSKHPITRGQSILVRYRARLNELEPHWLLFRVYPTKLLNMANCQTSYYIPIRKHQFRVCNSRLVCPWCYSRWASQLFTRIDNWLFINGEHTARGDLIWGTVATDTIHFTETNGMTLDRFKYLATRWYNEEMRRLRVSFPTGMAGWFGWFEGVPQQDGSVVLRIRYVGVAEPHATVMTDNRLSLPKRSQIVSTLVRLLSYKPGWVRCDPDLFAALLEIQWGRNSLRSYGAFRANGRS